MSCFWTSNQVAVAPAADPVSFKAKKTEITSSKPVEEVAPKEEAHKSDAPHKKSSNGRQPGARPSCATSSTRRMPGEEPDRCWGCDDIPECRNEVSNSLYLHQWPQS